MKNKGFEIIRNKGTAYLTPTFFDTYEQYECHMYLFFHGANEQSKVNTITLTNYECERLTIKVYDWEYAEHEIMSKEFYEKIKSEGFRWILHTNAFPIMNKLQHSNTPDQIERDMSIYVDKPISMQLKAIRDIYNNKLDGNLLDLAYLGKEMLNDRVYDCYLVCDWIIDLDSGMSWGSIDDQLYSIDCGNMTSQNYFVHYNLKDNKIYPILWVDAKYEVVL